MEEWKEYKLGELCEILDSKRIPLSSSQREKRKGCYPYYGAQGIIDYVDDYIFDGTYLLVAEDGENLKSRKQDIAQLVSGKYWVNNHAHILGSNGTSDIRLLCYILNKTDISGYITGSAQPKLNQANMQSIKLTLPSLPTQQKIANILSSLDDKIEVNRRINEQLEELAQALFKSWFVDFEPFKDGEFVDSELGMIPKGWKVGTLEELIEIKYGKDHKKLSDGNIPVFGSGGIMRYVDKSLYEGESVLIPRKGTLNNVMYVNRDFWTVDTMFFSKMKMKDIAIFVYLFLSKKDLASMNSGSAVPSMTVEILNRISLVIPSNNVYEDFNRIVSSLFSQMDNNTKEIAHLTTLRDTLLPKLMSGEIDVNEVEI